MQRSFKQLRTAGEASEVHLRGDDVLSKCQTVDSCTWVHLAMCATRASNSALSKPS